MSLLVKNTTPAERERGCVFSELFRDSSSIVRNDGTIAKVKLWKSTLTPIQIADLYQRELKQINDI